MKKERMRLQKSKLRSQQLSVFLNRITFQSILPFAFTIHLNLK
ncbi:hypothetical protein LEP1GSC062_1144 [Leptospira alexanderi serovar Manhao 3 str. L 60]|uniref:Uncharacterized protein n=1 Tax=Leptospira alexanderi serovar Manhao 3 str. L 60 TaxID=1049759 RepID=V6IEF1_9LEPT|nr:hypothetical protein LEP1GSC062_1144 [Leptospira alexanderi serovar Manhao 3 str. L 60]